MIEQLYRAHYPALLKFAAVRLESRELAEEAVQETFRIACTKPEVLSQADNKMGWLMEVLKLELQRIRRQQSQLRNQLIALTPDIDPGYDMTQQLDTLLHDPKLTKDPDFRMLIQFAVEGRSLLEISRELGISLSACKKRMQRAKQKLRTKLR